MGSRAVGHSLVVGMSMVAAAFALAGVAALLKIDTPIPRAAIAAPPPAPAATERGSADVFARKNPFDSSGASRSVAPGVAAHARCDGLQVHAILAGEDPAWSFASIAARGQKPVLRRAGGEVDGRTVTAVAVDHVRVSDGTTECEVALHDPGEPAPLASAAPARPSTSARPTLQGLERVSEGEYRMERATLDRLLENQGDIMASAQIAPDSEGGRVLGLRLVRVKPGSALAAIGLRDGDRLRSINGFELTSVEAGMMAYARLRGAPSLVLQLVRDGKPMELRYDVR